MTTSAWAVVPAGGTGSRFGSGQNKLTALLGGKPVLFRTLEALCTAREIAGIVVAAHAQAMAEYQSLVTQAGALSKPILWVAGGETRRASVYQGLLALPDSAQVVAIHDAARPLITPDLVDRGIAQLTEGIAGIIVSLPLRDTVKLVSMEGPRHAPTVQQTLDRTLLWRAQTPQIFPKALILQAHEAVPQNQDITDDAQLMELAQLGAVILLEGEERNLKITTPTDLQLAEGFFFQGF